MRLQNLHTHTHYCDGKDAPEAMICRALALGFSSLGFSGHIGMPYEPFYAMNVAETAAYKAEIRALAEKYKHLMPIYLGIEMDLYSQDSTEGYDYVIGSAHVIHKDGVYMEVDETLAVQEASIRDFFGGDAMAYARAYYENMMLLSETKRFDFVGHFDLLTKFRNKRDLFATDSDAYRRMALQALHTVAEKHDIFELNTGAISRGYRDTPYPDPFLLKEMKQMGVHVIVTTDCHDARFLHCHMDACRQMLRDYGFKSTLYRTKSGWEEQAL